MSRIAYEFFSQSPLLILPIFALVVFFLVFAVVVVRVARMSEADVKRFARLPLADEEVHNG